MIKNGAVFCHTVFIKRDRGAYLSAASCIAVRRNAAGLGSYRNMVVFFRRIIKSSQTADERAGCNLRFRMVADYVGGMNDRYFCPDRLLGMKQHGITNKKQGAEFRTLLFYWSPKA